MFTTTNKLRTIVAFGVASAALASSGVASAASVVQKPGTGTPVVASQPQIVAMWIDPAKVGSAGVPGYTDAVCQNLAGTADYFDGLANAFQIDGHDPTGANQGSDHYSNEVQDNCLVVD